MMTFEGLGLDTRLVQATDALGFKQPTPIQEQAIPVLLSGTKDLVGLAQTGTGKTAAFGLPLLQLVDEAQKYPQALVVCPTRELCIQIVSELDLFKKFMSGMHVLAVYGGTSIGLQIRDLRRGIQIVVATPGRLIDLIERKAINLEQIKFVVLDEADEMLNMGFQDDIEFILQNTPKRDATWLFSATMPPEIRRITEQFLHNPVRVEVSRPASTVDSTTQNLVKTGREPHDKRDTLRRLIRDSVGLKNAIIFCNRKREVALLHKSLLKHGFAVGALHGDMDQSARTAALDQFRKGEIPLLVASDVAARGLDIPTTSHVFNFDVPHHADDYVHRIGRTGRAGRAGTAISIVTPLDQKSMVAIEKLIGQSIPHADGGSESQPAESATVSPNGESPKREGKREAGREASRGGRKPRREREPRRAGGGGRHSTPQPQAPVAAFTPPAAPPASRTPSIGRTPAPQAEPPSSSEPADHSHLPAFLLRPVRLRV